MSIIYFKKIFFLSVFFSLVIFFSSCNNEKTKIEKKDVHFNYTVLNRFLNRYVADGKVKYEEIKNDKALDPYIEQVKNFEPYAIDDANERLAFWINAYNAFTIKLISDYYPVESILDIESKTGMNPWSINFIEMAEGRKFTLDEIEKKIILKKYKDPRIHYVLVCAAESCPVIIPKAYTSDELNNLLDDQAKIFLNDNNKNSINKENKTLELSIIYKWYKRDFIEKDSSVIEHLKKYISDDDRAFITKNNIQEIEYLDYSWKLNDYKKSE